MKSRIILSGMALALACVTQAAYTPVLLQPSSYNADSIVESNATPVLKCVTTATLDNGTNNTASTWYEIGYDASNPSFGLPAAGTVVTARDNANYSFRMPPTYVGNNGILVDGDGASTGLRGGSFKLTTPAAYNLLSFAGSGGNGGDVIGVRVNHADGTFETGSFGCPDWFGGSGVIMAAQGRMGDNVAHTLQSNGDNPRIYFRDVTLTNTTSPVTNIVLSYVSGSSGSHNDILAVSGATTLGGAVAPIAVTGYTYDFVVEVTAARRGQLVSQSIVDGTNVWATTQTYDNDANTGFTFYEKGYNFNLINNLPFIYGVPAIDAICQSSGIPTHGSTFTNAAGDHIYTMAPSYTGNDVVWVSPVITNATITLVTPTAAAALSFLSAAGNGPVNPIVIVHHQNGVSETNILTIQDWFSSATPIYIPNGRVQVESGQFSQVTVTQTGADRLFASDLPLTEVVSPVTSIDLVYTNTGGRAGIFAVSALTGVVPPIIVQHPASTNAMAGTTIQFGVQVTGSTPINFSWQKGTNGVFALLSNGGNVSGATTTTLTVSSANYFSDAADYRFIASNAGGSATSSVATATLFSTNTDVTQPTDPIDPFGANLFGDGAVKNAIDNNLGTKYGANLITVGGPIGLVVSPAVGATVVTALRFFTANDAPERDPSDYKLEGSINGGSTYTLIASNAMTLPAGRNSAGGLDPLVAFATEVHFPNASGYTTYRLTFSHLSGGSGQGSFQVGDIELLGVVDTSKPFFNLQPVDAKAYGSPSGLGANSATFTANATFTPTPTISWRKGTNGIYVPLTDGGNVSGSQTTSLSINPTTFADSADYIAVANSTAGFVTSTIAHLFIYSTNVTVTTPSDTIVGFGDYSGRQGASSNATLVIDQTFTEWINGGDGLNTGAGFPPFDENPTNLVSVVVTPAVGSTVLKGLRIYPGQDSAGSDPASFVLQGSSDGGTTYSTISSGSLSLPLSRNALATTVNPIEGWAQEVLFANTRGYTTYRLQLPTVRTPGGVATLSVGEIEFLGVPGVGVFQPVISGTTFSGGNLHFTISGGTPNGTFTVQTNANLTAPLGWGTATTGTLNGSGSTSSPISLPVSSSNPRLFYRILTP